MAQERGRLDVIQHEALGDKGLGSVAKYTIGELEESSGTVDWGNSKAEIEGEAPVRLEEGEYISLGCVPSASLTVTGRNFWDFDLEKQDLWECPYWKQISQQRLSLHKF
jgi:hypothetical protein